ncbi:alpha/beta hydrolase [Flindersiella endophytica]
MRFPTRAGIAALAGAALLAGPAAAQAAYAGPGVAGPDRYAHQKIDWKKCQLNADDEVGKELDQAGAQCADITVPLDYSRPSGPAITVAISRLPATDTKRRIGAIVLNGGGPGGPGIDMPPSIKEAMGKVGERYDVIGMDPRFVGRSTPLDCDWPTGSMIRSAGLDRADFDRSAALARDLAARCGRNAGDVLPYVSTRNTARDIDLIRSVLGERKLSYLGYSYGTYLGAVYAEMYPRRVDRLVLDGPIDPDAYAPRLLQQSGPANEQALASWASWAAERDATYGLGSTQAEVLATVHGLFATAKREPLHVGDFRLDVNILPTVFFSMLGSDLEPARVELAKAARVLADAAEQGSAEPSESLEAALRFLLTAEGSQYGSVQAAILCGDVASPSGEVEKYWQDIERDRAAMPYASPVVNNLNPCEFWPDAPREQPTRVRAHVPSLIVAATGDPRTIYANAGALQRKLSGSRVVTIPNANHHGVYGEYGNACTDETVNAYLASGHLPKRDVTCPR